MQVLILSLAASTGAASFVAAQPALGQDRSAEAFASENAILDTAIPFAIGAREARQALRGAFGWPSFQEGLVQGVYFRFDPDGYARFAPTPRLDVDVFEVICRPRTFACAARKDGLEVFLTERGQLQMRLEHALAGDMFYVSEGVSEIQVPERILQPLDVQLELLLGAGGELSTRRGATEVGRVSLKGFSAVTAYLRWIAARQDYSVLPRGWPVPNAESAGGMTQPAAWNSPMPQPQVVAPGYGTPMTTGIAPATSAAPLTYSAQAPQTTLVQSNTLPPLQVQPLTIQPVLSPYNADAPNVLDAETLRRELATLKDLFVEAQEAGTMRARPSEQFSQQGAEPIGPPSQAELNKLFEAMERLQVRVSQFQPNAPGVFAALSNSAPQVHLGNPGPDGAMSGSSAPDQDQNSARMTYLVQHLGFDAQTAQAILLANPNNGAKPSQVGAIPVQSTETEIAATPSHVLFENAMVDQILAELEAEMAAAGTVARQGTALSGQASVEEYQLLSRYFVSAALPALLSRTGAGHVSQP
ncbi:hypothetical protein [uncultured Shimia sp.]|uniref:hypothetical protein n=1 Tax=uncultured Shimia sp. TaxID=573152 RepID=UPI0025EA16F4|nr:hypothetical protein [uncultured Shimia sp.]